MVLLADKHGGLGQTGQGGIEGTIFCPASAVIPSTAVKVTNDLSGVAFETPANASTFLSGLGPPEKVLLEQAVDERAPDLAAG